MDYYEFVRGPLAYLAFSVFILGLCFRLLRFYWKGTNPKMLYPGRSLTNGIKAVFLGVVPFATRYMRKRPLFTLITVFFHLGVLLVPLFLLAHIILWFESYGVFWRHIPDGLADVLTLFVLFACVFFLIRRVTVPEVRQVSQPSDYVILGVIFSSFLTGFLAFHQVGPYRPMLIAHILCGEVLIVMFPFSRLFHMVVYPFSRYYMGEDFGGPLKTRDW
ncbi:MAG: hypothetical protein [Olavius algarvensis Delta 4 endosymbiont]|nr:MAG: hypothetical protein [Olavius algarvensis Delta 4 endosymbiont]